MKMVRIWESFKELLNKDIFSKTLKTDDLSNLNELLKAGISLKDSFRLLSNKDNEKIFKVIEEELLKGLRIEDVIEVYLPKDIRIYTSSLLKNMGFERGLELSLSFYKKEKENSDSFTSAILYPFILLFITLSGLYVFDNYALDYILNMLKGISDVSLSLIIFRKILRIIIYLFYFGLLTGFVLYLYFSNKKHQTLFYLLLSKYFPNSILQVYFCEQFVSLFLITISLGFHTREGLRILKSMKNRPLVSFLAYHLDERLMNGEDFKEAFKQRYFEKTLASYIGIGVHTNSFSSLLEEYVSLSKKKLKSFFKRLAVIIQLSSYLSIGSVIIFVYQILFIPMRALGGL